MKNMYVRKGDTIKIIVGKDRGKTGKILRIYPKLSKILVEGVNVYKKHSRPKRQGEKGEVIQINRPLHVSNVMLFCSHCNKPVRVGYSQEKEIKKRICKKCKQEI